MLCVIGGVSFYYTTVPEPTVTLPVVSYSVKESNIGDLLDFSEANQVLKRHLPDLEELRQLGVARALTLQDIQPYYPEMITPNTLQAIESELRELKATNVVVYTTGSTLVGVILDDPDARAIVENYLPGFSSHPDINQGRGFTLNFMQKFDRDTITDEKLKKMNADFEALARSRAGL